MKAHNSCPDPTGQVSSEGTIARIALVPPFEHEIGECWLARLGAIAESMALRAMADEDLSPRRSTVRLSEDGKRLGPPHSSHALIRNEGRGAFAHWKDSLYFSSSDGTDPNTNGKRYELAFNRRPPMPARREHAGPIVETGATRHLRVSGLRCESLTSRGVQPIPWNGLGNSGNNVSVYRSGPVLYLPDEKFPVFQDIVPEEAINHRLHFEGQHFGDKSILLDDCPLVSHEVCILGNIYSTVFGHWMEELLKVAVLEAFGFQGQYVIAPRFPQFCLDSLGLLGVAGDRILIVDRPTEFICGYFITNISHMNAHRYPHVVKHLRKMLYEGIGPGSGVGERVWIERGRTANRESDLVNREEVEQFLGQHGFRQVDFGVLDFRTQLQIDREATVMAGVHGSAFVHCGFMNDGGHVVEAFSPNFINPSVISLCRALRHRYNQLVESNAHDRAGRKGMNVEIDLTHLELILQQSER